MTSASSRNDGSRPPETPRVPCQRGSHGDLFAAFFKIGLCGFGGVAGWVRPVVVDERGWLNDREFGELLGVASVLPGANTVNLAVMLCDRFQGPAGALMALSALLLAPIVILIGVATLYDEFATNPAVKTALGGASRDDQPASVPRQRLQIDKGVSWRRASHSCRCYDVRADGDFSSFPDDHAGGHASRQPCDFRTRRA